MRTPRYSGKQTGFSIPLVHGLYKIQWIMWMFAYLSHKVFHHRRLIQQLDIIIALVRIEVASGQPFLPVYSKGELWNTDAFTFCAHSGGLMVYAL